MSGLLLKLETELKKRNYSSKTIKSYIHSVRKYLEFSKSLGLNKKGVDDYIIKFLKEKNPSTVAKDVFAIKFFFKNVLNENLNLPTIKRNKILPEILTVEEVRKLIKNTSNIKHKLIIKLLYGCGLRVSEVVNLKKEDLNFEEGLIHIKIAKGEKTDLLRCLIQF